MKDSPHPKDSRHPSKRASADPVATPLLDEALDETFPASDPIAVTPDPSEADLKKQKPGAASGADGSPKTPPRQ